MLIKDLGGEFALLQRILEPGGTGPEVVIANGDDAAVFECGSRLIAAATDTFIENRHFSLKYFSPAQVGAKALEASASDIVAVGGRPRYFLVNLTLPENSEMSLAEGIYAGFRSSAQRLGALLLGGDTTSHKGAAILSVTVLGEVESREHLLPRSGAKEGDLIYISGVLGGSEIGRKLIGAGITGFDRFRQRHLEPRCRNDLVGVLAPIANCAIDVSDGLSSEMDHVCGASGCGAELDAAALVPDAEMARAAGMLGESAMDFVLHGGEEFELLYTVTPEHEAKAVGIRIGVITANRGVYLRSGNSRHELRVAGFRHFVGVT